MARIRRSDSLVRDAVGTVLHLNPAAAALTGWTSTAAHEHGVAEVFPLIEEGSRQPIEAPVRYLLRDGPDGATSRAPLLLRRRDGAERAVSARAATVRGDDGGIIGTVLLFTDETERRQREHALRAARDRADEARREADRSNASSWPRVWLMKVRPMSPLAAECRSSTAADRSRNHATR